MNALLMFPLCTLKSRTRSLCFRSKENRGEVIPLRLETMATNIKRTDSSLTSLDLDKTLHDGSNLYVVYCGFRYGIRHCQNLDRTLNGHRKTAPEILGLQPVTNSAYFLLDTVDYVGYRKQKDRNN
jgi:hypothetical protein